MINYSEETIYKYECGECACKWSSFEFHELLHCPDCGHLAEVFSVGDARNVFKTPDDLSEVIDTLNAPMLAVGNDELGEEINSDEMTTPCRHCGHTHKLEYGTDKAGIKTKMLSFYKCPKMGNTYLYGIGGKKIK